MWLHIHYVISQLVSSDATVPMVCILHDKAQVSWGPSKWEAGNCWGGFRSACTGRWTVWCNYETKSKNFKHTKFINTKWAQICSMRYLTIPLSPQMDPIISQINPITITTNNSQTSVLILSSHREFFEKT